MWCFIHLMLYVSCVLNLYRSVLNALLCPKPAPRGHIGLCCTGVFKGYGGALIAYRSVLHWGHCVLSEGSSSRRCIDCFGGGA